MDFGAVRDACSRPSTSRALPGPWRACARSCASSWSKYRRGRRRAPDEVRRAQDRRPGGPGGGARPGFGRGDHGRPRALVDRARPRRRPCSRPATPADPRIGRRIAFVETIIRARTAQPSALGWGDDTIVFFNDSRALLDYRAAEGQVDLRSGIICFPNNFEYGAGRGPRRRDASASRASRTTTRWAGLPEETLPRRTRSAGSARSTAAPGASFRRWPMRDARGGHAWRPTCSRPRTVERFTGHIRRRDLRRRRTRTPTGARRSPTCISAAPTRGMLGIVGAMLSGITMANRHVLKA